MRYILLIVFLHSIIDSKGQNLLLIPDTIHSNNVNLSIQSDTTRFFPGPVTNTFGVNSNILGPTLILDADSVVSINVTNNLVDTTTMHWHGMHVSPENDGGPHTTIAPGDTWSPSFTVLDKAATYWYHPHLHRKTNEHVSKGVSGFIIVRDTEEASLNLPRTYGIDDFPLVLQTKAFDSINQIDITSHEDSIFMINATTQPYINAPAQVNRLRLLNGSTDRAYEIGFTNNITFYLIGTDGGLISSPLSLNRLRLSPGERAEILIDLNGMQSQSIQMINHPTELPNGQYGGPFPAANQVSTLPGYANNPLNLASYVMLDINVIAPTGSPVLSIPSSLANVTPLLEANANVYRSISLGVANIGPQFLLGPFLFDGDTFDINRIDQDIRLNDIEVWSLSNNTQTAHPFHIHDVQFYVLDIDGNPPPAHMQGRKDVVLIEPFNTLRFIAQFSDFSSDTVPYMYHCHMLTHEDGGMMGQFVVRLPNSIEEVKTDLIKIFPNPLRNTIHLESEHLIKEVQIFNLLGQTVYMEKFNAKELSINLNLNPGSYVISVDGKSVSTRTPIVVY